ncbi:MAG: PilZ domain-containing protein [Planctomycetota bacterium]|nr:PilZ domain-containing protein [Planctomycetota bacterium]
MSVDVQETNAPSSTADLPPAPLKFERRLADRVPVIGRLRAVRCDVASRPLSIELRLIDEAVGGFGADSTEPLPPGAQLMVCTSPESGIWRTGKVVRCRPIGSGYRIGVAYERRRAA